MKVKFALPELFGIHCRWVPNAVIFLLALIPISRAVYATEGPALSPPVMQAQQVAEETVEKIVQFRHLEGLREIFGDFSHANSDVASNLARRKQAGGIKIKLAEEALARIIENPNSQSMSTLPEPAPLLEPSSKPEDPTGDWFLWGFGAGVRTGYDSYNMPEISWTGGKRFIVREDSFKSIAFKNQENFLSSQHIRRSAANAFTLGFKDGWHSRLVGPEMTKSDISRIAYS
jgi:hypothetical protein